MLLHLYSVTIDWVKLVGVALHFAPQSGYHFEGHKRNIILLHQFLSRYLRMRLVNSGNEDIRQFWSLEQLTVLKSHQGQRIIKAPFTYNNYLIQ